MISSTRSSDGVLGPKSQPDLSGRFLRYSSVVQWGAYPDIGMLAVLGAVTLESLGLMLNPLNRTLQPMRMVLARGRAGH